ncbi:MAG: DUF4339 domain-containing protein [Muribaculaceae bacterium]|nr:DUF4339 domain-containing protein [Muribaculaceae bacterium]
MEYYFAILDGKQVGPMPKADLPAAGVTRETLVWRAGMPEWQKAESIPELNDIFMEDSAFGGYARPEERPKPYNPQPAGGQPIPHTNWMPWAILGTVLGTAFSCIGMIFGIIGIVKASKANGFYQNGMGADGDVANSSARVMTIIALVLGGLGLILMVTGTATKLMEFALSNSI